MNRESNASIELRFTWPSTVILKESSCVYFLFPLHATKECHSVGDFIREGVKNTLNLHPTLFPISPFQKKYLRLSKLTAMNFPENLKYTKDHEWVLVNGNTATIGITDFAQSELGDIVYVEIETEGDSLDKEAVFGTVEAVKTVSDLFMPVSGKVTEFNNGLTKNPESVNKDPYGTGWMIKVEMSNAAQANELLSAADYKKLIGVDA